MKRWKYKREYPSINIHPTAEVINKGEIIASSEVNIGECSKIYIPPKGKLVLGEKSYIGRNVELGPLNKILIGDHTSIQDRCIFVGDVNIGKYCLFSLNVLISSGKHHYDLEPYLYIREQDIKSSTMVQDRPVTIEDDCWIGVNVVIMPGVTIGKGSIVGANSVVTKDVSPYTVVAGAPAKIIKNRLDFDPPFELSHEILEHLPYFYSGFYLSNDEREMNKNHGGLLSDDNFTLAINVSKAKNIHLRIKSLVDSPAQITYQDQKKGLTKDMTDITFDVRDENNMMQSFAIESPQKSACAIVNKVWLS